MYKRQDLEDILRHSDLPTVVIRQDSSCAAAEARTADDDDDANRLPTPAPMASFEVLSDVEESDMDDVTSLQDAGVKSRDVDDAELLTNGSVEAPSVKLIAMNTSDDHVDHDDRSPAELGESSPAELGESSSAELDESSLAELDKSSPAELGESSPAELVQSSPAELGESSSAELGENSPAELGESSPAELGESSPAELGESSPAELGESSSAELDESSPAELGESSPAELGESSPAELGERSPAELDESSPAELDESSPVELDESSPVELGESSPAELGESRSSAELGGGDVPTLVFEDVDAAANETTTLSSPECDLVTAPQSTWQWTTDHDQGTVDTHVTSSRADQGGRGGSLSWDELPSKSDAPRNQRYEMIVDDKLKLFRAVCEQRRARSYEKSDFVLIPQVTCLGYIYVHFSALIAL